jgi:hypothetical protein
LQLNFRRLSVLVAALACSGAVLSRGGFASQAPPPNALLVKHDPVIGCIVAGQFPILQSCVSLASAPMIGECRANFKAKEAQTYFYVRSKRHENTADQACFQSILPKAKKSLKEVEFHFQCFSKDGSDNRTEDFTAKVVENKGGCDKDKLAAPISPTGPPAVIGSGPGFAVGAGNLLPFAGATLGVGALTTALVVNNDDDNDQGGGGTTTTTTTIVTTTTTTSTSTTSTTSTTQPTQDNRPPEISCSASPTEGEPPLTVQFRLCGSRDPDGDSLRFEYDFGDGGGGGTAESCSESHTYGEGTFTATACVSDRRPDHKRCCTFRISSRREPPPTPSCDTIPPTVAITSPATDDNVGTPFTITASASDNASVASVTFFAVETGGCDLRSGSRQARAAMPPMQIGAPDTIAPYSVNFEPECFTEWELFAVAKDNCGNETTSATVENIDVNQGVCSDARLRAACATNSTTSRTAQLAWASQLEATGAAGRVSLNGTLLATGQGRQEGVAEAKAEENRVDGEVLQGSSSPGLWRFELGAGVAPSSVRVLAGDAVQVSDAAVVFRISGAVGERVSFSFRARDE